MIRLTSLTCLALLAAVPATAQQGPRILPVSADAAWVHANSGLTLPVTLIGLPRTQVREFEGPELDVVGTYTDGPGELTVYVYRTLSGAVPVWFDRAVWAIESRDGWGTLTPIAAPVAVAPPGRGTASGLAQGWTIAGGPYRGTAVALLPMGEWLVKLRYSSKADDGPTALAKVRTALAGLTWPAAAVDAAAAVPVAACPDALRFKGQAKALAPDLTSSMMGALLANASTIKRGTSAPARIWCRDAATVPMGAVYRPDAQGDGYLLALSDAGRGIWVGPAATGLVAKDKKIAWGVDFITPGRTIVFPEQDRLPAPEQVLTIASGRPNSVVTTWGKERTVTISPDALKSKK
ncbi:hypothetical protein ASE86_01975 [Sphingomonas sp. Leaf33]|uniref:hypothetical protein n=1 Tax=Sphingomonas sp. Leaf33 TaxID=1736215 RepID=UPI0006FF24AE|nr:hypothetical protein [Sphingomonas sp. Leaf33]KQN25059.1 hypothetical protein ASE86_01975 [Sphingomonas sp. Leaf33]